MSLLTRLGTLFSRKDANSPDWGVLERYIAWAFGGGAAASGMIVNPQTAMQTAAVWSCIKVLAESVSMLPCNLLLADSQGKRSRAIKHPLFALLHDQPNDYQTAVEFWEMCLAHLCLRGNAYAFVNRGSRGNVVELLPQHPDMVRTEMRTDYTLRYQMTMADGSFRDFGPGEIFHIRGMSLNGWLGISPIAYARESIGLSLAAEKFGGQLFRNGAKMGGVLEHPGKITDDAYKRIKESFDAATSGENAHKTALLEEGMKFSKISMTAEDSQFLDTRKFQRSEIASIYRVPPHMIGDLEKATFANIEQMSLEFVSYSLMPWLVRIEKAVKRDLLRPSERTDYSLKFNTFGLLRGDAKSRSEYYASGIVNGWLTRNEAREAESDLGLLLNPLPKLDAPLLPLNMRSVDDPLPVPVLPPAKVDDPADPTKVDPAKAPRQADDATAKAIGDLAHAIRMQPPPQVQVDAPVTIINDRKSGVKFQFDENHEIVGAEPVFMEE